MKVNVRQLLETCVERGVRDGYQRAHKHTESPSPDALQTCIEDAIWLEIDTYFNFDDTNRYQDL